MTLPARWEGAVEQEALAFARDWIERCRAGDFGDGYAPLHPEAGRAFTRRVIKNFALTHPFAMDHIVAAAGEGWDDADIMLRGLIAEYTSRHEPLPAPLASYNIRLINPQTQRPPKPRGRKMAGNVLADIVVAALIMTLLERFPLKPTRSQIGRKRKPSACSIAHAAMTEAGLHRGAEATVQKIWQRYEPAIMPGSRAEALLASR